MNYLKILLGAMIILIITYNAINSIFKTVGMDPIKLTYIDTKVTITDITNSSTTIKWESQEKEITSVEYGTTKEKFSNTITDKEETHLHTMVLNSLLGCTQYYYHITSSNMLLANKDGNFTTLCDNAKITNKLNTTKEDINE